MASCAMCSESLSMDGRREKGTLGQQFHTIISKMQALERHFRSCQDCALRKTGTPIAAVSSLVAQGQLPTPSGKGREGRAEGEKMGKEKERQQYMGITLPVHRLDTFSYDLLKIPSTGLIAFCRQYRTVQPLFVVLIQKLRQGSGLPARRLVSFLQLPLPWVGNSFISVPLQNPLY